MNKLHSLKCLNALHLKLLAMFLMLCDHAWATVLPGSAWCTNIGRLAFPIFAFQIVEGFYQTHDRKRYLKRMLFFALVSEIPFDLMYGSTFLYPFHQNVMFTFLLALLFMSLMERFRGTPWKFLIVSALCGVVGYFLGDLAMVDYFGSGMLMVFLFYWTRGLRFGWVLQLLGMIWINTSLLGSLILEIQVFGHTISFYQQALAVLALVPIWLYNGKQGYHSKPLQYACYAFYPVHMLILWLVQQALT